MNIELFHFGAYSLKPAGARLLKGENTVPLPPKALAALIYLIEHRGNLVGKDELLDAVWGHRFVSQGVLKNTITTLRQALDDDPKNPLYIETVHRLGYRFIAEVTAASAVQTPAMTSHPAALQSFPDLVDRAGPLAELGRLLEKAVLGKPQLAFVTGEPGIGKTALIEAFLQSSAHSVLTGRGQCVEQYGQGEPYLPVLEALNDLIRHDEARLSALLRQVAPTWLAQLPWYLNDADQPLMQQVLAGTTQMRMLREFGEFLGRCTAEQPLILVLEDLHWSDHATLDLLAYLARRKQPARWLILGSFRPEDVMFTDHGLMLVLRELQIQGLCSELPLELLSEAAIAEYLAQRLTDRDQASNWARAVHNRTGGLPFFLVQLVETVQNEQATDCDVAMQTSALPNGVQQLLTRQFERLSDDCRHALEAASVVGMTFSAETLAAALSLGNRQIEEHCEALARPRLFITGSESIGRYRFRHAFYREFAYNRLPPLQSARLHLKIGEWLESTRIRPEELAAELALHFERGREWEKGIKYLQLAAANALARHALHETAQLLRRGLRLLEDQQPMLPHYARYGRDMYPLFAMVLQATQGYGAPDLEKVFERALELARQSGESPRLLRVLWGLWSFHYVQIDLGNALDCAGQMQATAEQAGDTVGLIGAHVALGATLLTCGKLESSLTHARRAIALYDSAIHNTLFYTYTQDPGVCAWFCEAQTLWLMGFAEQAKTGYDKALGLAEVIRHPYTQAVALGASIMQYVDRREPTRVVEYCEMLEQLCTEHGFLLWQAMTTIMRGWALALLGQSEEGVSLIQHGLTSWRATGSRAYESRYLSQLAEALAKNGEPELGIASLSQALVAVENPGEHYYEAEVHRLRGELLLEAGSADQEESEKCFHQALAVARRQQAKALELRAATSLARLWRSQGRLDDAKNLLNGIYGWFTEGFDTPDLLEAKALLDGKNVPAWTAGF